MYYTYILECADKTLYCGYTNDIEARVRTHNLGLGAKYTKARLPVRLVYSEEYQTRSEAMSREAKIKMLKREEKLKLINGYKGEGEI